MKKTIGFVFSLALILGACGKQQAQPSLKQQANQAYQAAVIKIKQGDCQAALAKLSEIKDTKQVPVKVTTLKQDLKQTVTAQNALTEGDLTKAQTALLQLDDLSSPQALKKQVKSLNKEYQTVQLAQTYYTEVTDYYQAAKYFAAGGSLQSLQALSSKYQAVKALQNKAKKYNTLINTAQKQANASDASDDTNARNSKIVQQEYAKQTGQDISSASSQQVSQVAQSLSNDQIIEQFITATAIPKEAGDQYYVQDLGNDEYQIEIRHTSSADSQLSNLKGMYKFNAQTKKAQKLNEITGQYVDIN